MVLRCVSAVQRSGQLQDWSFQNSWIAVWAWCCRAGVLSLLGAGLIEGAELPPPAEKTIDFVRDIQPLFAAHCLGCHGPRKQEGSLRLDHQPSAFKGGETGVVIEPGASAKSLLIHLTAGVDADRRMPPEGEPLTAEQVGLLRAWIDQGANWPESASVELRDPRDHWAFKPPQRPSIPTVAKAEWPQTPVDNFILERLEREKIQPSPRAEQLTIIRRLYLDLVGLPPSLEEVDAFLADSGAGAYERLVEKLLESPHYGERWGRHWLDAARYADSDGFEKDKMRFVWAYRQWVIEALNRDMPYDEFIIAQLAGDLLPEPTQDQLVATGFLRNSMINEEGGVDPEQFRMEAMFDRMDAIGKSVLGLTIQCAQCHNHKYDPLTQAEYYQMFACLNNSHEANMAVYTAEEQQQRGELYRRMEEIETDLQHRHPDWAAKMANWEVSMKSGQPTWTVVQPPEDLTGDQKHYVLEDSSILAQGYAPTQFTTEFIVKTEQANLTGARLELLCDANLPLSGPGRSIDGLCALTEFRVFAGPSDGSQEPQEVKIVSATADVNPPEAELAKIFDDRSGRRRVTGPIELAIDNKDETAWGIDAGPGRRNVPRKAVFVFEKPINFAGGAVLKFHLVQSHGGWNSDDNQNNNLGRFRFSVTSDANPQADPLPSRVREILAVAPEQRSAEQVQAVFSSYRATVAEWAEQNQAIEGLWKTHPVGSSQLVLQERDKPRSTHVLKRGDFLKPAQPVAGGVPSFLHAASSDQQLDRLGFARWLVDRRSPTTARAVVNRLWQTYFGVGLVSTSEDLGMQAEAPSHPELLDWLAVELMDHDWSLKHIHRLIVKSATYQQASTVVPEVATRDPLNRWLSRAPRLRVEGEVVRDIALTASGLLNRAIGGPSVFPPLPEFMLLPPVSYGPKVWYEDHGPNRYRRALYTFRYRSIPYPVLQNFDAPNGDFSCVRRSRSNTPLQALTTLNEPIFMECAQALARETLTHGGATDEERLIHAFRRCVARQPQPQEQAELLALLRDQYTYVGEGWVNAWELGVGDTQRRLELPPNVTPAQLAAWTVVSRVLLNLDETITKE